MGLKRSNFFCIFTKISGMINIQIPIDEELVELLGLDQIRALLQEELAYQRFRLLEANIQRALQESKNVNWESEFEEARAAAFREYQQRRIATT
jgi:post-segregation antitoxin (ccd killing protein)